MDNWFPVPCQLHWAIRPCATEKGQILYPTNQLSLPVNSTILTKLLWIIQIMIVDYKLTYPSGTATAYLINGFHTPQGAKLARWYTVVSIYILVGLKRWEVHWCFLSFTGSKWRNWVHSLSLALFGVSFSGSILLTQMNVDSKSFHH